MKNSKVVKARSKKVLNVIITYCILLIVAFIFFFPCLWLILASFSKSGSIYSFDGIFPTEYSLDTFELLFTDTVMYNYPKWFLNTLFIATMSCILGTLFTILSAYVMSRFRFKTRKAMMKGTLVLGMFPSFMGTIAVYLMMTQFNLINQQWGLILIYAGTAPMGYLTQKGFFDTIPYSIDEAARIDGASEVKIFSSVICPLAKPAFATLITLTFLNSWNDFQNQMADLKLRAEVAEKPTAEFTLVYSRAGVRDTVSVTTDEQFKVAAIGGVLNYTPTVRTFGFFESFPAGITLGVNTLKGYVNDLKYVFTKEGAKSVGGFGTIGSIFPTVWDWQRFWSMTAFLSIILAFMNILPIPALDGGHVLFLIYEIVARRKPSDKFLEYAQMVGMFLLFALLIWANFNDVLRFLL